jgi:hypothetical protein
MALSYFDSKYKKFTMEKLDKLTGHIQGKYTWQSKTILWLDSHGYDVIQIEPLDYKKFSKSGEKYLMKIWSPEMFQDQKINSDLDTEIETAKQLQDTKSLFVVKVPSFNDLIQKMEEGYIGLISINPFKLDGEDGISSHMIVMTGYDQKYAYINDPGKPASKRKIDIHIFEASIFSATFIR